MLHLFINLVALVADHQDGVDQSRPYQYLADLIARDSRKGYSNWRCYLGNDCSSAFSCVVICRHDATSSAGKGVFPASSHAKYCW